MSTTADPPVNITKPLPPRPVSFEAFHDWLDEDIRAEWVDGEICVMSPSSLQHQFLMFFIARLIAAFVEARQLGVICLPPFLMRLPTRPRGREPDLLFVATEHLDRLKETYLDGPADLVVEIVSPDSDERDHGAKRLEYEAAAIPEYWLLDPLRRESTFYQLGTDGRYHPGLIEADGIYRSRVLDGFWPRTDWLWQQPLPSVPAILRELGL